MATWLRALIIAAVGALGAVPGVLLLLGHVVVASTGTVSGGWIYRSWELQFGVLAAGALSCAWIAIRLTRRRARNSA